MNWKQQWEARVRERDEKIVRLREAGMTHQQIADTYGITRARVSQILAREARADERD